MATVNRLFSGPNEVWFDNFSFSINFNKFNIDQFVSSFDTSHPHPLGSMNNVYLFSSQQLKT